MLFILVVFSLWSHAQEGEVAREPAGACGEDPAARDKYSAESINERYDDFFRRRRQDETRERERERGREEIRDRGDARTRDLELARREYIRIRRPSPDTAAAEGEWEQTRKARAARVESARRCYVTRKNQAEGALARGRQIPANAEFGLDE